MTKVLIVEDEATLAETLMENLTDEGYEVFHAADGEAALAMVRAKMPDLVVLDVMLPILDGLSVCRIIRKDATISHIPIIMLTARGAEVDKIVGLESGADDYIVKPFGLGEFLARVRAMIRRMPGRPALQSELIAHDLRIDLAGRKAFRGANVLQLSHKEFDLLSELMRNQGAVLSRDLILTKVWGYEFFGDKRTVDVHIRWLREKIEDDPSTPQRIVTVRGVGYRFEG
ncbi:MAG TPA: response regulator transcription factor [Aggregatilineales bacterium]|nr:response regulator transcription factor [Anaerolineales bacterium]HRE49448.1 response regulator transcription factor [Aggregatilineales bacterium]